MPTSEQLAQALHVLTAVLSYGIDGANRRQTFGITRELGLTPEVFATELYQRRPRDEEEIAAFLRCEAMTLWLVGPVGVGKSSLAHVVLAKHTRDFKVPLLVVDFKVDSIKEAMGHSSDSAAVGEAIERLVEAEVDRFAEEMKITTTQLALEFTRPGGAVTLHDPLALRALLVLRERFRQTHGGARGTDDAFFAWTVGLSRAGERAEDRASFRLFRRFASALVRSVRDRLMAMTSLQQIENVDQIRRRAVVLLDNLDSIEDIAVRDGLKTWLRTSGESYKRSVLFVACLRPENDHLLPDEVGSESHDTEEGMFGEGGAPIMQIGVESPLRASRVVRLDGDPAGVSEDAIGRFRARDANRSRDPEDDALPSGNDDEDAVPRRAFDDAVIERRVSFLRERARRGHLGDIPTDLIGAVCDAFADASGVKTITDDSQCLSNGNRRDMLAGIANFLEYVLKNSGLHWSEIGGAGGAALRRRHGAMKSLYYKWVASGFGNSDQHPVFNVDCYNPVRWTLAAGWSLQGGRPTISEERDSEGLLPAVRGLSTYLILVAAYNISCNAPQDRWRGRIEMRRLVEVCASLGITEKLVVGELTSMIQAGRVRFHGFIEATRFREIYNQSPGRSQLRMDDSIHLTDRACRLLERVGLMFNYLVELIYRERARDRIAASMAVSAQHFPDFRVRLADADAAHAFVKWVRMLATTEIRVVEEFRDRAAGSGQLDWLKSFRSQFCISRRADGVAGKLPLLTQAIAGSGSAHLRNAADVDTDPENAGELRAAAEELLRLREFVAQSVVPKLEARQPIVPRNVPLHPSSGAGAR